MTRGKERGVALILTMILVAVLTVITVSLMFLSQSETWTSMNYRLMSQSRDAAEAGLNVASNILMGYPQADGFAYVPPTTLSVADPLAAYDITVSPVIDLASGLPVILSTNSNVADNYPAADVEDGFEANGAGAVEAGTAQVSYTAFAELLSMREITEYGSSDPMTIQTWRVTSTGNVSGVQRGTVEVSAVLDRPIAPVFSYAAFGESSNCGALNWGGTSSETGSYDSSTVTPPNPPTTDQSGGNVGTNGNLNQAGGTTIYGTLSTPRSGVGNCNNGNVNALDINGGATVTGGLMEMPQAIDYPEPEAPTPTPPTTNSNITNNASCLVVVGCVPVVAGSEYRLTPTCADTDGTCAAGIAYGNITVGANKILHLSPGTYSINSLRLGGNAQIVIDCCGAAVLNFAGQEQGTLPCSGGCVADFSGGTITNTNANYDPATFQIMYAGTLDIRLTGGAATAGLVYAPNAGIVFSGGGNWYGSVIGETVRNTGGANIYYDRQLQRMLYIAGPYMLHAFTWKKF